MSHSAKISVLIPTLGRGAEPIETIRCLEKQSVFPEEIIVVDQNQPEIPELSQFLKDRPRVRHLRFQTKGVSLNYNRALLAAQGEIVLFLDDDTVFGDHLVAAHLRNYERDPELGGVMGRVEQPGDISPDEIRDVGVYHAWSGTVSAFFNAKDRRDVDVAQGVNMSFRREILLHEDGFDLGFGGNGYYFEADMSLRVRRAGKRIVFDPDAGLTHLMAQAGGTRVKDKARHTYFYARNGVRLFRRHSPKLAQPWLTARLLAYLAAKSAYNRDPRILSLGLKAVWEGLTEPITPRGASSDEQRSAE